jgi:hypothetical protein
MALWVSDIDGKQFDDGLTFKPGEDGFTRDIAAAHYANNAFSYVGTPNWQPPQEPEEAA